MSLLTTASLGRMALAVAGICGACAASEPGTREDKIAAIVELACQAQVPPGFALAVLDKESQFNNAIRGRRGEVGVSQIVPSTARRLGLDVERLAAEFRYNAEAGISMLKTALGQTHGDQMSALLYYRTGPQWRRLSAQTQQIARRHAQLVLDHMTRRYASATCPATEAETLSAAVLE